jgi:hypothetical protein
LPFHPFKKGSLTVVQPKQEAKNTKEIPKKNDTMAVVQGV